MKPETEEIPEVTTSPTDGAAKHQKTMLSHTSGQSQQLGPNSAAIQIIGNNNSPNISIGTVESLQLIHWSTRCDRAKATSDVQLLQPYRRATEMVGREHDMDLLLEWLNEDHSISVRTLIGRGGSGKTRLAIELLRGLDSEQSAWIGGFLSRRELVRFLAQHPLANWKWRENCVVVVDYAATFAPELRELLRELTQNKPTPQRKLRLLLLEREGDTSRGWLQFLQASGESEPVRELFHPVEPRTLAPISSIEARRAILRGTLDALRVLGDQVGNSVQIPKLLPDDPLINKQLTDPKWSDPLYLMMAGLLIVGADIVHVLGLPRRAIAEGTVGHEIERLRKFAGGDPNTEKIVLHMAAVATLRGGLTDSKLLETIAAECAAIGRVPPHGAGALADLLRDALPARDEGIGPILPDLLGEAVLMQQLSLIPPGQQTDIILRAVKETPAETAEVLLRVCHDYAESEQSPALRWLDTYIDFARNHKPSLFLALCAKMPQEALILRGRAVSVAEECLKLDVAKDGSLRAAFLMESANRHNDVGECTMALARAREASELFCRLAQNSANTFRPYFALSLNILANALSAVGLRAEALAAAHNTVELWRELAKDRPEAFLSQLAVSLKNLSCRLTANGQRDGARIAAQEAVDIWREFVNADPVEFLPHLAMSLNTLAGCFRDLGRPGEALAAIAEVVQIRRELAKADPDAFLHYLAGSLSNLANCQREQGNPKMALQSAQEAAGLYGQLAESHPAALAPQRALCLNNLAGMLASDGQHEAALAMAEESVRQYRELAKEMPDTFWPDLARSLDTFALCHCELMHCDMALAAAHEAVRIRRQLANLNPSAFLPDLAVSYGTLGFVLDRAEEHGKASMAFAEGLIVISAPLRALPQAFSEIASNLFAQYMQASMKTGQRPNSQLISPVVEVLYGSQTATTKPQNNQEG